MQQDCDIKAVFERLSRGVKAIEDGLKQVTGRDQVSFSTLVSGQLRGKTTKRRPLVELLGKDI